MMLVRIAFSFSLGKQLRAARQFNFANRVEATIAGILLQRQQNAYRVTLRLLGALREASYAVLLGNAYEWDKAKIQVKSMGNSICKALVEKLRSATDALRVVQQLARGHKFCAAASESQLCVSGRLLVALCSKGVGVSRLRVNDTMTNSRKNDLPRAQCPRPI